MSFLPRSRSVPAEPAEPAVPTVPTVQAEPTEPAEPPAAPTPPQDLAGPPAMSSSNRVPRTRTGAVWFGICVAAVAMVVLIVFMLQNTRSVEVSFLWMHGSVPLALALLVAGFGVAILAMAVGEARVAQLRRLARRPR